MYGYINHLEQFVRPNIVEYNGEALHNPSDTILAEQGYLLRVDTKPPSETGYEPYYVERDGQAVQCWRKQNNIPTSEERIAALEAALLELMGVTVDG